MLDWTGLKLNMFLDKNIVELNFNACSNFNSFSVEL